MIFFRSSTILILLIAIIFQGMGRLIIVADYQINKDFIVANFCENESKPEMKCEGKCHMKKQLEKEDKKDQSPVNHLKIKIDCPLYCEELNQFCFFASNDLIQNALALSAKTVGFFSFIFQPPRV